MEFEKLYSEYRETTHDSNLKSIKRFLNKTHLAEIMADMYIPTQTLACLEYPADIVN